MPTELLIACLIALLPTFIIFLVLFFLGMEDTLWSIFGLGILGWIIALLLRIIPLQTPAKIYGLEFTSTFWNLLYTSILAGVFEESIRYILMKKVWFIRQSFRHITSFGLGWGFGEAAIIYVGALTSLWMMGKHLTLLEMLPGAVERNLAVVIHVALTFILFKAMVSLRFLWFAMGIHAGVDLLAAVSYHTYHLPVWIVEVVLALASLTILFYAYILVKGLTPTSYLNLSGLGE